MRSTAIRARAAGKWIFLVVKDFDDLLAEGGAAFGRTGSHAAKPRWAAIRHATAKLLAREARTRLLVLINDGRPLDDAIDEYSLEDTKGCVTRGASAGVHPFVSRSIGEADGYVRRMYGDVQFAVIDHLEALPKRLPRIYQRLTT